MAEIGLTKEEQTSEIFKSMTDIEYFAEKYCKVWDKKNSRWIPFKLMPHQVKVLRDYENHDRNVVLKYRQGGITTLTCLYLAHIIFTTPDIKIAIVANKKKLAMTEILTNICNILNSLPDWLTIKPTGKDAADHKIYSNKTEIMAFAATKDGVRGFSPDILLIDEAAYLDFGYEFWTSAQGSLSAGGRVFMISCVTEDTFVYTNKGVKQVKNFIDKEKEGGYLVKNYKILGKDKLNSSNIIYNNGFVDTRIIKTTNTELECSRNHKLWAFSKKENKFDWYESKNLEKDDYISMQFGMEVWGHNDNVKDFNPIINCKHKVIFKPNIITKEIAYLFGLYIAEGYCYVNPKQQYTFTFTCGDDISWIFNSLKLPFYLAKDGLHYNVSSKTLGLFFEYVGFNLNHKAPTKVIPERLLEMSRENIIWMIRGMMDGDGCANFYDKTITYTSSSIELIKQLRILLLNFGVQTDFIKKITPPTKKVKVSSICFVISATQRFSKLYFEKIGFNFERKQKIYEFLRNKTFKNSAQEIVPNGGLIINQLCKKYSIKGSHLPTHIFKLKRVINRKTIDVDDININLFTDFYDYIKNKITYEEKEFLSKICGRNLKWLKIRDIEESKNLTYDFSLPHKEDDFWCHSVIYNGIVGHQTPKSHDDLYYPTYEGARTKKNKFNISEIYWWWDVRFNEDLSFVKVIDENNTDIITDVWLDGLDEYNYRKINLEKCKRLIKEGYKPTSSWFEGECAGYNYDKKRIAQELENKFLGSGGNMIDEEYIMFQENSNVREPIKYEWHDKNMWIWDEPEEDTEYYIIIDVSSGSSSDYMAVQIIDIKNSRQVGEYQGRIKPEEVADLGYKYAKRYNNAFIIIDVTGTIGSVIIYKLMNENEYNYKNVYKSKYSNKVVKDKLENFIDEDDLAPGFYIGKNRTLILENFEQYIRQNYFICRSIRIVNEMKTFVWNESIGRFDHTRSSHDDLLFAAAIGLYVYNESFVVSKKGYDKEKALAFINSWTVVGSNTTQLINNNYVPENVLHQKEKNLPMMFYIPKKN